MAQNGLLSAILDTTGERVKERVANSQKLDNEQREAQAAALLKSIYAVDENGKRVLSDADTEDAWARYEALYKQNKSVKDIILKAKDITSKIFGGGLPANPAMAERAATKTQQATEAAPPAPAEPELDPAVAETYTGLTPPPARTSVEPAQAPAPQLPAPPKRSMASLVAAGAPNPVAVEKAKEVRAEGRAGRDRTAAADVASNAAATQHGYRLEEIEAGKKDLNDVEIDTFTTKGADGKLYRATTYKNPAPGSKPYTIVGTTPVEDTTPAAAKSGQAEEVILKDGTRTMAVFNPDLSNPVRVTDLMGKNITALVDRRYHQPSSFIQGMEAGKEAIPGWVNMANTGQIKNVGEIPSNIRNQVVKAMNDAGVQFRPPAIRERYTSIQGAKELLKPIEKMIADINNAKTMEEKAELSYTLGNFTQNIGTLLARSLGERGVATEGDVDRATGLVPGWKAANFAPEFAKRELNLLKGVMDAQERALETYFKESTSTRAPAAGAPAQPGGLTPPPSRTTPARRFTRVPEGQ